MRDIPDPFIFREAHKRDGYAKLMNHGHYGIYNKHTTLILGHQKLASDKPLALQSQGLSMASFL